MGCDPSGVAKCADHGRVVDRLLQREQPLFVFGSNRISPSRREQSFEKRDEFAMPRRLGP